METFKSYVNEVIDYLEKCIASGKCEEIDANNNNSNWILKLFYDNLHEYSDGELLVNICKIWTAFGSAYVDKFKKQSEYKTLDDVILNYEDYFKFCMERKFRTGSDFTYSVHDFINIAYDIAFYHNKFCKYVKKHKDCIADAYATRDTYADVDFYTICDDNTLARINECYKDMDNEDSYDEYIDDLLEDYRKEHLNEFTLYKREIRKLLYSDDDLFIELQ